ncbi:protein of unknown function [Arachidicoccus rhizosphaerae]|uniref:DUF4861 domain-containing protein n=1 Tax=Arachidicoccus rhizosphaerae TaxID=551991 RepID=A0A1H3YZK9_9BACT|nr:DUF4861 family protein [Arachidicoccus rhizosphaerae]SEA17033.1 protein of unknown function [Arachidicoccus rhizosphaerae]
MRKILFGSAVLISLMSCAANSDAQHGAGLTLKNTTAIDRPEQVVSLSRKLLEAKAGPLANNYLQFSADKKPLQAQFEDLNGDGKWDEVLLCCPIKASASVQVSFEKSAEPSGSGMPALAHARMKLKNEDQSFGENMDKLEMPYQNPPTDFSKHALPPYLTEGPGWENDKVAFRLYFDTRNNKDIYGKRIPGMVMDSVGANPKNSYHKLAPWGMDILKVGTSLGAGALAFSYRLPDGKDTLVRLGGNDIKGETYQLLSDGPLQASFLMTYPWQLAGNPVTVTEKITITAGQYSYTSDIAVQGEGLPKDLKVNMGIADFYTNQMDSVVTSKSKAVYSFGQQSENHDNLGMAVISDHPALASIWQIKEKPLPISDITSSYLMELPISSDHPVQFRFYAGWGLSDPAFNSQSGFKEMLERAMELESNPVIID